MNETAMCLARDWAGQDPKGWFITEKLDGCRAYWDGKHMWTRGGQIIQLPKRLSKTLPAGVHLDGEIFAGRGRFEEAKAAVQYNRWTKNIRFVVFDRPDLNTHYDYRMQTVRNKYWDDTVELITCSDRDHLIRKLRVVQEFGGEGLVIRNPRIKHYETGRTNHVLKVKRVIP